MRMIEDLFYGNICPCEKSLTRGSEYSHLLDLAVKNEENLSTSYQPKVHLSEYCSNQFDGYLQGDGKCNYSWKGMYISVFKALDSYLIIQHDEPLKEDETISVKYLVEVANQRYQNELSNF